MGKEYYELGLYGFGFIYSTSSGFERFCKPELYSSLSPRVETRVAAMPGQYFDTVRGQQLRPIAVYDGISPNGEVKTLILPLYVVREDGKWYEYFTGTEIQQAELEQGELPAGRFDVDTETKMGIRQLAIISNQATKPMDSISFSQDVSKLSEDQKKSYIAQFNRMIADASAWGPEFDKQVAQYKTDIASQRARTASEIDQGFGQYANTPSVPLGNENSNSSTTPDGKPSFGGAAAAIALITLILLVIVWFVVQPSMAR